MYVYVYVMYMYVYLLIYLKYGLLIDAICTVSIDNRYLINTL